MPRNISKYKGNVSNIVYRSLLELRAMQHFDTHPDVLEWSSEETVIPYRCPLPVISRSGIRSPAQKIRRYFVDFLVKCRTKTGEIITLLIEVKPFKETQPPTAPKKKTAKSVSRYQREVAVYLVNQAKWAAAEETCNRLKWQFKIMTEKTLRF